MQLGLVDENGNIVLKKERDFVGEDRDNIEQTIEKVIVQFINELLKEAKLSIEKIGKIGIAAPGTIKDNEMVRSKKLGLQHFKLPNIIQKHFQDTKITINNDAKCAALCEKAYGSLKAYDDAIFLCLGTGIGGAVFFDGKLLKPKRYAGFELRTHDNRKKWKKVFMWQIRLY